MKLPFVYLHSQTQLALSKELYAGQLHSSSSWRRSADERTDHREIILTAVPFLVFDPKLY